MIFCFLAPSLFCEVGSYEIILQVVIHKDVSQNVTLCTKILLFVLLLSFGSSFLELKLMLFSFSIKALFLTSSHKLTIFKLCLNRWLIYFSQIFTILHVKCDEELNVTCDDAAQRVRGNQRKSIL